MKAATIAAERRTRADRIAARIRAGRPRVESEHFRRRGRVAWVSCRGASSRGEFQSGRYQRGNTADAGRLSGANPFGFSRSVDRDWNTLEVLNAVAVELDRPADGHDVAKWNEQWRRHGRSRERPSLAWPLSFDQIVECNGQIRQRAFVDDARHKLPASDPHVTIFPDGEDTAWRKTGRTGPRRYSRDSQEAA